MNCFRMPIARFLMFYLVLMALPYHVQSAEVSVATIQDMAEPAQSGQATISLSEAQPGTILVEFHLSGSATAGTDYEVLSAPGLIEAGPTIYKLILDPGQVDFTVQLSVLNDLILEPTETAILTLFSVTPSGDEVFIGAESVANVQLFDDEVVVPEPTTYATLGCMLCAVYAVRRRTKARTVEKRRIDSAVGS